MGVCLGDLSGELGYSDAEINEMLEAKTLFVWEDENK